jgi:hypothetical protein
MLEMHIEYLFILVQISLISHFLVIAHFQLSQNSIEVKGIIKDAKGGKGS